jgi:hypothetical protein
MKIGILSDTHIPYRAKKIPRKIFKLFSDVDLILHAGDIVDRTIIKELEIISKVEVVKGNMDEADNPFPVKKVLNVEEVKIGLIHGNGTPFGIRDRIRAEFDELDIIVYGHSHKPYNKIENEVLFFNPGTPTDKVFALCNSVGILEVNGNEAKGKIIRL